MINAKEANELYKQSSAEVKTYLAKIDSLIREAATKGQQQVALRIGGLYETAQYQPIMTPIQRRVEEELESLGFTVTFGKEGNGFVPFFKNSEGNGPIYYDFVLVVGW